MLPIRRNIALLSGAVAANTAILQLTAGGFAPLAIAAVVLVTVPALWILRGRLRCHASQLDDAGTRRCTSARGWLNLEATR